jgi:hypothetical protein
MSSALDLANPPLIDVTSDVAVAVPRRRILPADEAAAAVRAGIVRAARDCEAWGGDWPSDRGCENLLQVRAAEELHARMSRAGLGWLTLEEPFATIIEEGTTMRGRPRNGITNQKRADIAIKSKADRIYGVIEIKRAERDHHWRGDLEKLARIVSRYSRVQGNHVRYGILGVYISKESRELVDERAKALKYLARSVASEFELKQRTLYDREAVHHWDGGTADGWTCGAATVTLTCRRD